ncbi:unnamed protein product [Mytilus coruscus]|uniref:Reverse transcriptase domain-containing protein n=1 Tax=Mytilus coruscus TaxID=42192 RepID=A0A6J8AHQ9_MYTCO|nr:unnamed protein product [Mytilus coruscus]
MDSVILEQSRVLTKFVRPFVYTFKNLNKNSGKATDEFIGLAAEHFKNSPTSVTHFLTNCFNNIFNIHHILDIFKSGIVTPVLKKGKNPMLMDNYRGIAITPVISKLFECTILPHLTVKFNQSSLQFGFTKGLSMLMASLVITEARAEVKLVTREPLFLIIVDSQKAFDVVDHIILLDALYDHTQNHPLWEYDKEAFFHLLYKVYVNNLLEDLKSHSLGLKIGTNYVGCPTCADDIAFLSSSHQELQCMFSVATHHARQSRVTINPTKTKAVILNKPKNINRSDLNWTLGNTPVYPSEDTTHLGLIRAELKENNLNVDARISIKRRTLHSLMNTGLHGTNGLNPQTSYEIYQSYVIPRLLYGMEILPLHQSQLDIMTHFHTKTLCNIQSLPTRQPLDRYKFSGGRESALCKCCGTSDEDIIHFLLLCPALHQQRKETFSKLKSYVISVIGLGYWSKEFKGHLDLIRLIVDSSFLLPKLRNRTKLDKIQRLAMDMCYRLHSQRVWKLQGKY